MFIGGGLLSRGDDTLVRYYQMRRLFALVKNHVRKKKIDCAMTPFSKDTTPSYFVKPKYQCFTI